MSSSFRSRHGAASALLFFSTAVASLSSIGCTDPESGGSGSGGSGDAADAASTGAIIVGPTSTGATPSDAAGSGGSGEGGSNADATSAGGSSGEGGAGPAGTGTGGTGGTGGSAPIEPCPDFASEVVAIEYGPGAGFGQDAFPDNVFGGPRGAGEAAGSLDVLSLGNGGSITLGFADRRIVDGDGPDFIVFENAFWAGGDPELSYAELATVEVSADGETWKTFPCTALEAPYGACAGFSPVHANVIANEIDPLDPEVAGGEAFDLADVGLPYARWVRIVDRADQQGFRGIFDLDAVAIVHGSCDAAD